MSPQAFTFADEIDEVHRADRELLIHKNRQYGNSALEPVRICSRASTVEQLLVRIDDLRGYLILLEIARRRAG